MPYVTVPGGTGATITIPYLDSDNAAVATAVLENLYATAVGLRQIVYASGGRPAATPGEVNVLIDDTTGDVAVPIGYQYLVDDFRSPAGAPYPLDSFIAGGVLDNATLDAGPANLQFMAGTGRVTIVAGGQYAFNLTTLNVGSGGGVIDLDGGAANTAVLNSGNWMLTTGTGPTTVVLGSGFDTVYADGADTVRAGIGISTIILQAARGVAEGGSGRLTIGAGGLDDTVFGGTGLETVFGAAPGAVVVGGSGDLLFVDNTGGDTVYTSNGGLVAYGVVDGPGSVYVAQNDTFLIYSNSGGDDTVIADAAAQGPAIFDAAGGKVVLDSAAAKTFVAAADGPETIDASGSSIGVAFFAGTGATDLIGNNNVSNFFGANTGSATLSGGIGNVYEFTDHFAGGIDLITHFGAYDGLYLYGYGLGPTDGIASDIVQNGTLDVQLNDGTRIIFQNISSFAQIAGQIHHGI